MNKRDENKIFKNNRKDLIAKHLSKNNKWEI